MHCVRRSHQQYLQNPSRLLSNQYHLSVTTRVSPCPHPCAYSSPGGSRCHLSRAIPSLAAQIPATSLVTGTPYKGPHHHLSRSTPLLPQPHSPPREARSQLGTRLSCRLQHQDLLPLPAAPPAPLGLWLIVTSSNDLPLHSTQHEMPATLPLSLSVFPAPPGSPSLRGPPGPAYARLQTRLGRHRTAAR